MPYSPLSMLDTLKMGRWECGAGKEGSKGGGGAKKCCTCCGLGHKHVRYLWNICTQRERTCSHYAVWPSQLLQVSFSSLSAHSPTKCHSKSYCTYPILLWKRCICVHASIWAARAGSRQAGPRDNKHMASACLHSCAMG